MKIVITIPARYRSTRFPGKVLSLINGKPMLEHIIGFIKDAGITDFGIVVGYKQSMVTDYFKDGASLGISITYIEQKEQNGTGAALHLAKKFVNDAPFFFLLR